MQNQNLQPPFIEINSQANYIAHIRLVKNRHMISGLVNVMESINNTAYHNNIFLNSLNYARSFLLTPAKIITDETSFIVD